MDKSLIWVCVFLLLISSVTGLINITYKYNPYTAKQDMITSMTQPTENLTIDNICFSWSGICYNSVGGGGGDTSKGVGYLYNISTLMYLNETKLNATIDARMTAPTGGGDTSIGVGYLYNQTKYMYLNETKLNSTIDAREQDTLYYSDEIYINKNLSNSFNFNETKLNETISASIGNLGENYYPTDIESDVVGFELLSTTPHNESNSDSAIAKNNQSLIDCYLTAPNNPYVTVIPAGVYSFFIYGNVSSDVGISRINVTVSKTNSTGGNIIPFFGVVTTEINGVTPTLYRRDYILTSDYTINITDRFLVCFYAQTDSAVNKLIGLSYGGMNAYTYIRTTLPSGGDLGFVRYIGSTNNVDLDVWNLSANNLFGNINASYVLNPYWATYNQFINNITLLNDTIINNNNSLKLLIQNTNTSLINSINGNRSEINQNIINNFTQVNTNIVNNNSALLTTIQTQYLNITKDTTITGNLIINPGINTTFRNDVLHYGEVYYYNNSFWTNTGFMNVSSGLCAYDISGTTKLCINASAVNYILDVMGKTQSSEYCIGGICVTSLLSNANYTQLKDAAQLDNTTQRNDIGLLVTNNSNTNGYLLWLNQTKFNNTGGKISGNVNVTGVLQIGNLTIIENNKDILFNSTNNRNITFTDLSDPIMTLTDNDTVSIGAYDNKAKLTVYDNYYDAIPIAYFNDSFYNWIIGGSLSTPLIGTYNHIVAQSSITSWRTNMEFRFINSTASSMITMTPNKVGIGINAPIEKFEVNGTGKFLGNVNATANITTTYINAKNVFVNDTPNAGTFGYSFFVNGTTAFRGAGGATHIPFGDNQNYIRGNTTLADVEPGSIVMMGAGAGKAPGIKLQINGTVNITGDLITQNGSLILKYNASSPGFTLKDRAATPGRQFIFENNDPTSLFNYVNIMVKNANWTHPKLSAFAVWNVDEINANAVNGSVLFMAITSDTTYLQPYKYGRGKDLPLALDANGTNLKLNQIKLFPENQVGFNINNSISGSIGKTTIYVNGTIEQKTVPNNNNNIGVLFNTSTAGTGMYGIALIAEGNGGGTGAGVGLFGTGSGAVISGIMGTNNSKMYQLTSSDKYAITAQGTVAVNGSIKVIPMGTTASFGLIWNNGTHTIMD
jgi:hypothetical protein